MLTDLRTSRHLSAFFQLVPALLQYVPRSAQFGLRVGGGPNAAARVQGAVDSIRQLLSDSLSFPLTSLSLPVKPLIDHGFHYGLGP